MQTNNQNLDNFFRNFKASFAEMERSVKNNEWSFKYDAISDILYFAPRAKKVSADSVLIPAGDSCISARVGSAGNIENIVIEDFGSIFVPENSEFKNVYQRLVNSTVPVEPVVARRAYALVLSDFRFAVKSLQLAPA